VSLEGGNSKKGDEKKLKRIKAVSTAEGGFIEKTKKKRNHSLLWTLRGGLLVWLSLQGGETRGGKGISIYAGRMQREQTAPSKRFRKAGLQKREK